MPVTINISTLNEFTKSSCASFVNLLKFSKIFEKSTFKKFAFAETVLICEFSGSWPDEFEIDTHNVTDKMLVHFNSNYFVQGRIQILFKLIYRLKGYKAAVVN